WLATDLPPRPRERARFMNLRLEHRLAVLRTRLAAESQLKTPILPGIPAPPSARRTARISVKYYSMNLAERDGPSSIPPTNYSPIEIDSDSEIEAQPEDTNVELVDMEEEPEEESEEDPEEDPEEEPEEENQGEEQSDEI
ncbi:hypothetical protein PIB30_100054, partial [Stylosanthes scabra]|nr:hypothetical protein [Stylosanthes scabra]